MTFLANYFRFADHQTDFRRETIGGLTTFITMAYITAVNPAILSEAFGRDLLGELLFATCVSAAVATLVMGISANYPFALAPGMGLNAYLAYTVVLGMGVRWDLALGVVLASGLLFTLLSLLRIREAIINAVPETLKHATAVGIGFFIAFIGLKYAGIVSDDSTTLVTLGNLASLPAVLTLLGTFAIAAMLARKLPGAILIGVLGVTLLSILLGHTDPPAGFIEVPEWPSRIFGVAIETMPAAFEIGLIPIVFAFLFVDVFDTMGTLLGLSERAGFLDHQGRLPRANRALLADSLGTMVGAVMGTSTVTTYIESGSGISAGARTGFASVVTGLLFLVALFFSPLIAAIPVFATAPALIVVGVLMTSSVTRIDWSDITDAVPAFLTAIVMPLSFSIADGLAIGFISYPIVKRAGGKDGDVHPLVDVLAVIFIARYLFLD